MKNILTLFFLSTIVTVAFSQVSKSGLSIGFNREKQQYETYLHVIKGEIVNKKDAILGGSQVSIVSPQNSVLKITDLHSPTTASMIPSPWEVSTIVESCIDLSFHSVVNQASPTSFFPYMMQGDSILLFSFKVTPPTLCASDIRLFDGVTDPESTFPCMNGSNMTSIMTFISAPGKPTAILPNSINNKDQFLLQVSPTPCTTNIISANVPGTWTSDPKSATKKSNKGVQLTKKGLVRLSFDSQHPCVSDTTLTLIVQDCVKKG